MAVAVEAIKGFIHLCMGDWPNHGEQPRRILSVLDVLEP